MDVTNDLVRLKLRPILGKKLNERRGSERYLALQAPGQRIPVGSLALLGNSRPAIVILERPWLIAMILATSVIYSVNFGFRSGLGFSRSATGQ